ncbi:ABC transporter permease [Bradyrhizobium sp. U87765 SZCCT0131]|uniref:ABC transporter permease n=1 Tax=unclassified Bradyrhizobium TaxID=2631580 RepID=UPI001BA5C043|nr:MULTISPECIES: ABC transporter permease [unclassified Bradyrhizobium]MBR1221526.1 ABC transporter permease [Bradyrhizobium sp. U87765 SZCCT0131]MBR1264551.1 ABC transporter permease [Bradyrhizobium sp. U87765 SZCCT0134]MBR1304543.1 ABC transporter permease [Bradyrhizobium sp. U87765 SZCCT0110]MBR1322600.1 ABC transporter permease [Bradyrhizobium sp. U87765 SZCCT0109]MBR1346472.1 ABC transporter permease [Bradyrhizobium sp. U87765 SZCCT0048]
MSAHALRGSLAPGPIAAAAVAVSAFLVLPLVAIVPMSFSDTRFLSLPRDGWSILHYRRLFGDPAWHDSLLHSVGVAVPAACLALVFGLAFCLGAWQRQGAAVRVLRVLMLGPLIVPAIIHAVAYHRMLSLLGLFDSFAGTVLVHAVKGLPFVVLSISAALSAVNPMTLQLARSLGASQARAIWSTLVPQIHQGMAVGFILAFVTSWDEVVVTLFITSRHVNTLPKQIWQSLFLNLDPAVAALGTLTLLATLLVVLAMSLRGQRDRARAGSPEDGLN